MIPARPTAKEFDFQRNYYTAHKKKVYSVGWNSLGNNLASASADGIIWLWNFDNLLKKDCEIKAHTEMVQQILWHPDNPSILASTSDDKSIKIWDIRTAQKEVKAEKTKSANMNIAWAPQGSTIAVGNKENEISFYDFRELRLLKSKKFTVEVNEMAWDTTGSLFFVTTGSEMSTGPIQVFDGMLNNTKELEVLECHRGKCMCIAVDPSGKYFATGASDALVALWDVYELITLRTFTKCEGIIFQLSFTFDGQYLATASEDHEVAIYDVATGDVVQAVNVESGQLSVKWHPKRYVAAFAGDDKSKSEESGVHILTMTKKE
eukprot:TRINITY_DN23115_c0_g1_i2.p1 TRINITY_DN23115_c0_g1~~TRINITY_DN23115_c0_g1_i2.p1  ORF type:complete len:320 (+),score=66.52 TRINITY_DN23115_c0_g1_i2:31-990(+)